MKTALLLGGRLKEIAKWSTDGIQWQVLMYEKIGISKEEGQVTEAIFEQSMTEWEFLKNHERHPCIDSRSHKNFKQGKIPKHMIIKLLKTEDNKILKTAGW